MKCRCSELYSIFNPLMPKMYFVPLYNLEFFKKHSHITTTPQPHHNQNTITPKSHHNHITVTPQSHHNHNHNHNLPTAYLRCQSTVLTAMTAIRCPSAQVSSATATGRVSWAGHFWYFMSLIFRALLRESAH